MDLMDLLIERKKQNEKYFLKPVLYTGMIKKRAEELFGKNIRTFLFGSIVKGNFTPLSDIDVLVVAPGVKPVLNSDKMNKIVYMKKDFEIDAPFSIILCNEKQYEDWFHPFILDKYTEV